MLRRRKSTGRIRRPARRPDDALAFRRSFPKLRRKSRMGQGGGAEVRQLGIRLDAARSEDDFHCIDFTQLMSRVCPRMSDGHP
jgi:hypothetical protein